MGFFNLRKGDQKSQVSDSQASLEKASGATEHNQLDGQTEKGSLPHTPWNQTPRFGSSRASLAQSTRSSAFVDEIKHEAITTYLFQQQCRRLWVENGSGVNEGVMVRKSRGMPRRDCSYDSY